MKTKNELDDFWGDIIGRCPYCRKVGECLEMEGHLAFACHQHKVRWPAPGGEMRTDMMSGIVSLQDCARFYDCVHYRVVKPYFKRLPLGERVRCRLSRVREHLRFAVARVLLGMAVKLEPRVIAIRDFYAKKPPAP